MIMRHRVVCVVFFCVCLCCLGRPGKWAVPMEVPGVPNLHKIDDNLYRSAQPTEEGFRNLAKMGIKTVVCLRSSFPEENRVTGTGLNFLLVPLSPIHIGEDDIAVVLRIITGKHEGPYLIHCRHGADRTGVMSASYRMCVEGWSSADAIEELKEGGYGFHSFLFNIPRLLRKLDVEAVRRMAGIK